MKILFLKNVYGVPPPWKKCEILLIHLLNPCKKERKFVKSLLKQPRCITERTVLTRNGQCFILLNVFSATKMTHIGFRFRRVLSYIDWIEVVDTFFKSPSVIFRFNHLDNIELPYFVKFLVGSFYHLFTELSKRLHSFFPIWQFSTCIFRIRWSG